MIGEPCCSQLSTRQEPVTQQGGAASLRKQPFASTTAVYEATFDFLFFRGVGGKPSAGGRDLQDMAMGNADRKCRGSWEQHDKRMKSYEVQG